jgi:CRISPR-associated endoribonuclease Cas6
LPAGRRHDPLYRVTDFAGLALPVSPKEVFLADFRTPTAFKMGDAYYPFPDPGLFFSSLLRRWNAFSGDDKLPEIGQEEWRSSVWLSRFRGKTKPFFMRGGQIPGFTGQLWLQLADPEKAKIAVRLLAFAPFAGVGVKTAMGMGQVRVASAKQPRP